MCFEKLLNLFPNTVIQFFDSRLSLIYRKLQTAAASSKSTNSLKHMNENKINKQTNKKPLDELRNSHLVISLNPA